LANAAVPDMLMTWPPPSGGIRSAWVQSSRRRSLGPFRFSHVHRVSGLGKADTLRLAVISPEAMPLWRPAALVQARRKPSNSSRRCDESNRDDHTTHLSVQLVMWAAVECHKTGLRVWNEPAAIWILDNRAAA